jgi:diadenosine tetraphosphate (Ap4A) HIT family hydrolase
MVSTLFAHLASLPDEFPGMDEIQTPVMYLMGCGSPAQFANTLRGLINPARFCPFCPENRASSVTAAEKDGWLLFENEFPKDNAREMWLVVPERHLTSLSEMTPEDAAAAFYLAQKACEIAGIEGGGLLMRFGKPHLHVGTIPHLHLNVIEPICGIENRQALAKSVESHAKNYGRLIKHRNALVARGGERWLFSKEGIRETRSETG